MTSLQKYGAWAIVAVVRHKAKAWNRVLAEGLWWELGKRGVDVLACVAGATDTPGYRGVRIPHQAPAAPGATGRRSAPGAQAVGDGWDWFVPMLLHGS